MKEAARTKRKAGGQRSGQAEAENEVQAAEDRESGGGQRMDWTGAQGPMTVASHGKLRKCAGCSLITGRFANNATRRRHDGNAPVSTAARPRGATSVAEGGTVDAEGGFSAK